MQNSDKGVLDSNTDFRTTVELAASGIAHLAPDGRFLYANPRFCDFFGRTQEEIAALSLQDISLIEELPLNLERIRQVLNGSTVSFSPEQHYFHKDGRIVCARLDIALVKKVDGSPRYLIVTVQKIERPAPVATELDEREAVLRATFDRAAIGITHISPDGRFIRANQKFHEMLGYSEDELSKLHIVDLGHPDDRFIGMDEFKRSIAGDISTYTIEKRFLRRDGSIMWGRITGSSVRDATTGDAKFNVAIVENITERKRTEEALRESEQRFRVLIENTAQAVWETNSAGQVISDSPSWRAYTGQAVEEWMGYGWLNAIHPEDRDHVAKKWQKLISNPQPINDEFRLQCAADGWRWTNVRGGPLIDPDGAIRKWVGMNIDVSDRKLAEERLQHSEEFHRITAEAARIGIWEMNVVNRQECSMSPLMAEMLGLASSKTLFCQAEWESHIFPEDLDVFSATLACLFTDQKSAECIFRVKWEDGSVHHLVARGKAIKDARGTAVRVFGAIIDMTDQRRTQEELKIANERLRLAVSSTGDGLWDWDFEHNICYISSRFKEILGYDDHELPDHHNKWPAQIHPEDEPQVMAIYEDHIAGKTPSLICEYRIRCKDDAWKWVLSRAVLVKNHMGGKTHRMIGMLSDISERKKAEERIWQHANFDALTQLPNRRLFRDCLEQEVKKAHRSGESIALLFIDLDSFKQVNDLLGHDAGDLLLIQAAKRIDGCVRRADTIARPGGDEFTVILPATGDIASVEHIARKIIASLTEPFQIGQELVYISGSAGIALYPDHALTAEELIRKADQAMYVAKHAGKNQFRYFTHAMDERAQHRTRLINDLHTALANGQLSVAYQPVVELSSNRIVKAEALLRWQHPVFGNVEPTYFVPLAEESGLIIPIGDWVFREAASRAKCWSLELGFQFQIGVNKSPVQFLSQEKDTWLRYLREMEIPAQHITVEITEGVLLDASDNVCSKLLEYRDAGIQVALDDFGVGYSSLSYLKKFDIDYLKIDKSFVQDMTSNDHSRTIAETIIVMAHKLGLKVIAEGIETMEQKALLLEAGCDYGQGFLFSKAIPASDFEREFINPARSHAESI